jgi:hypothetical protein
MSKSRDEDAYLCEKLQIRLRRVRCLAAFAPTCVYKTFLLFHDCLFTPLYVFFDFKRQRGRGMCFESSALQNLTISRMMFAEDFGL